MKKMKYLLFLLLLSFLGSFTSPYPSKAFSFYTLQKSTHIDALQPSKILISDPKMLVSGIKNIDPKMLLPGNAGIDPKFLTGLKEKIK